MGCHIKRVKRRRGIEKKRGLEGGEEKSGKKGPKIGQKQVGREVGVIVGIKKTIRETGELTLNSQKRQRTKNDKYQVWRHNLSPQLLSTFKSISRIICKMGHFYKRCQIQMDQRDNLSFRSNIYVQYIQIKFYFRSDRNIYYGNNFCVAVSRCDTTCQYQLLSSSLSRSSKYYETQITASIYAKNRNHTFETGIVNADYANGGCFCLYACAVCGIGK